jgi:hypothetical protein
MFRDTSLVQCFCGCFVDEQQTIEQEMPEKISWRLNYNENIDTSPKFILFSISEQSTFAVAVQKLAAIVNAFQRCRRTARSTKKVNVSVIIAVNHAIIVAVSCVFDHVLGDDSSGAWIVFGAIFKRLFSLWTIIRESDFTSVSPVDSR